MPVSPPKGGGTLPRSRDENSVSGTLKYVTLSGLYNVMGFNCTRIDADGNRTNHPASNTYRAKSLEMYGTRILVDGEYWMPVNSGAVVGWVFAD